MRLWGSLSFIAASLGGGWVVERPGAGSAIWLVVVGMALTTAARRTGWRAPSVSAGSKAATSPPRLELAGAIALLRSRTFLVFLVAAGGVQSAHAVLYTFGTLHWRALGLSAGWCGALWAISIVCRGGAVCLLARRAGAHRRPSA